MKKVLPRREACRVSGVACAVLALGLALATGVRVGAASPVLWNVDFGANPGSPKSGPAAFGLGATDYWNAYWFPFTTLSHLENLLRSDGTLIGGVSFTPGRVGSAFRFDGLDDRVRIPAAPELDLWKAPGLTVEGWVLPEQLNTTMVIAEWHDLASGRLGVHLVLNQPWPTEGSPAAVAADAMQFNVTGLQTGRNYVLEQAGTLPAGPAAWESMVTILNASESFQFTDPEPPVASHRFYRLRVIP